jgi:hypothetical protein
MKLKLLYNRNSPKSRWVIWERNIGKSYLGGVIGLITAERITNGKDTITSPKIEVEHISHDNHAEDGDMEHLWKFYSRKQLTDTYRKFTPQEYITISTLLKMANMRYNKKKDEFVKK